MLNSMHFHLIFRGATRLKLLFCLNIILCQILILFLALISLWTQNSFFDITVTQNPEISHRGISWMLRLHRYWIWTFLANLPRPSAVIGKKQLTPSIINILWTHMKSTFSERSCPYKLIDTSHMSLHWKYQKLSRIQCIENWREGW